MHVSWLLFRSNKRMNAPANGTDSPGASVAVMGIHLPVMLKLVARQASEIPRDVLIPETITEIRSRATGVDPLFVTKPVTGAAALPGPIPAMTEVWVTEIEVGEPTQLDDGPAA